MAERGITGALADDVYLKLSAFANYGFPESHAMSFAYLVYASAWLKRYHPAAFCAALLNAQPMGFYSPQSLVDDARRHGVTVLRPDINVSNARAILHSTPDTRPKAEAGETPQRWGSGGPIVRLGLSSVRTLGDDVAGRIEDERRAGGPYRDMTDLARRAHLSTAHLEALATADAFASFGLTRRAALWAAGAAAQERHGRLPGTTTGVDAPPLPGMDAVDELVADVWATGLSPDTHPVQFARDELNRLGVLAVEALADVPDKTRVLVGGIVTHRQRPATARGVTFINLEDETGMLNITCSPGLWHRYRRTARVSNALLVRGMIERADGVMNLNADRLSPLTVPIRSASRDFR
jgi:error-prone DNA polymerase